MEQGWTLAPIALLVAPFVAAIVYGIRHPRSGSPAISDSLEADPMFETLKDVSELRHQGRPF